MECIDVFNLADVRDINVIGNNIKKTKGFRKKQRRCLEFLKRGQSVIVGRFPSDEMCHAKLLEYARQSGNLLRLDIGVNGNAYFYKINNNGESNYLIISRNKK